MPRTKTRIVILGGGFGGLFTALGLIDTCDVTLVNDESHFLFKPMLYEYFSGEVEKWHIAPEYKELLDKKITFIRGEVTGIDLSAQVVSIKTRQEPVQYDILVLALGGVTNYAKVEGAEQFTIPFRRIADADLLRRRMVAALDETPPDLPAEEMRRRLTFVVVGAGASGVELSTKMADLLVDAFKRRALNGQPRVMLIEMGDRVVPGMGQDILEFVEAALSRAQVEVHTKTRVIGVTEKSITLERNGERAEIGSAAVVWTGGVRVNPVIENLNIEKARNYLILVKPTLQVASHDNVFALGDIALYPDASPILAGTAQLAVQEAGLVEQNIRAFLRGEELKSKHFEELGEAVSLGTHHAAVLVGGRAFGGPLARQARFALYTSRLPTWQHRLKVGASWFFEGTTPRPLLPLGL